MPDLKRPAREFLSEIFNCDLLAPANPISYRWNVNTERIRQRVTNGFRPFALELSSGKRYVVPHPEFIMIGRNVVAVLGKDDSVTTIDALHIVALEDLPTKRHRS